MSADFSVTQWDRSCCGAGVYDRELTVAHNLAAWAGDCARMMLWVARQVHTAPPPRRQLALVGGSQSPVERLNQERARAALAPAPASPAWPLTSEADMESARRIFINSIVSIRREYPHQGKFDRFAHEFVAVSDPDRRFGEASAHDAAWAAGWKMVQAAWRAVDLLQFTQAHSDPAIRFDAEAVRPRFREVCEELANGDWPDLSAVLEATKVEVAKAAVARLGRPAPPPIRLSTPLTLKRWAALLELRRTRIKPDYFDTGAMRAKKFGRKWAIALEDLPVYLHDVVTRPPENDDDDGEDDDE